MGAKSTTPELSKLDLKEHQTKWLKRLAAEVEKVRLPALMSLASESEDCPAWVARLEQEVGAVLLTELDVKKESSITPRRMGSALGHVCALAVWIAECFDQQGALKGEPGGLSAEQRQKAGSVLSDVGQWYAGMRRLAKLALCSSVDQSYEDMSQFLTGFAAAFAAKPKTLGPGGMGSSSFEVQVFLLLCWRQVAGLKSVSELHALLVKVFGPHRAGDLKRVEKICQRLDLSFRKPGRPKKLG